MLRGGCSCWVILLMRKPRHRGSDSSHRGQPCGPVCSAEPRLALHTGGTAAQWGRQAMSGDVLEASPQRQMLLASRGWRRGASQHPARLRAAPTARVTQPRVSTAPGGEARSLLPALRKGLPAKRGSCMNIPTVACPPGGAPPPATESGWAGHHRTLGCAGPAQGLGGQDRVSSLGRAGSSVP